MSMLLPWILALAAGALVALLLALTVLYRNRRAKRALPSEWLLTSRPIFSHHERRVHRQLREALPHCVVLAKLPLVRFCQARDIGNVRYWYRLLGSVHVSFAICNANGRVLAALDLDDGRESSSRSVQIKRAVFAAAAKNKVRPTEAVDHIIPVTAVYVIAKANCIE